MPILLALMLSGCASQYTKPCTVNIKFTLDENDKIDEYCKQRVAVLDDGTAPKWNTTFKGCANGATATIHSREDEMTWGHEVRHVLDYHCGKN